jgi:hypothetical protein
MRRTQHQNLATNIAAMSKYSSFQNNSALTGTLFIGCQRLYEEFPFDETAAKFSKPSPRWDSQKQKIPMDAGESQLLKIENRNAARQLRG